jgi:hypothetical protein
MDMIVTPIAHQEVTTTTVPLHRDHLRQASLFDEGTYPLPTVLSGRATVIVDSDEGYHHNFQAGIVIRYGFLTGIHTIQIDSIEELGCYGREIVRARK